MSIENKMCGVHESLIKEYAETTTAETMPDNGMIEWLADELIKAKGELGDIQADIRNKLSPIKTLCFMLGKLDPQNALGELILEEIKECEKSIEYLQDFLIKP